MKTIVAIFLLVVSGIVSAGPYSEAAALQTFCNTVGNIGEHVYTDRHSKHGDAKQKIFNGFAASMGPDARNADVLRFAINFAYDKATDAENARLTTWAYCMDNAR